MFFLRLIARLPFWILYGFSDVLFVTAYYVVGYRKKMVQKNLRNAFPNKSKNQLQQIEKQFYKNLCDYAVETLKLITLSKNAVDQRVKFINTEILDSYIQNNQPFFFVTSHQFNWEWVLAKGSFGLGVPADFVYQKLSSAFANQLTLSFRCKFGAYPIERQDVGAKLFERRKLLRGIATLADQFPGHGDNKRHYATFLQQRTAFFEGLSRMCHLMQYPIVFIDTKKVRRGHYEAHFSLLAEPPYDKGDSIVMDRYITKLEKAIQEQPDNWLWSHNRWKNR